ncbi:hypothetical protein Gpo141_00012800 [Globisporangium polare]
MAEALGPGPPMNAAKVSTPTTAIVQPTPSPEVPKPIFPSQSTPVAATPTQAPTTTAEHSAAVKQSRTAPTPTTPQPTAAVLSTDEVDRLKSGMTGVSTKKKKPAPAEEKLSDEKRYCAEYRCARASYNLRLDGYQRMLTPLEDRMLHLWTTQRIHLIEPPRFVTMTHTGAEQDVFWNFQRNKLGYRLYAVLPTGFVLPAVNTRLHFCRALLAANIDEASTARVKELARSAQRIMCSARSQIAEFVFTRPDVRDRWANKTFRFGRGHYSLKATDSSAQKDASNDNDDAGLSLMYQAHVIDRFDLDADTVRKWVGTAADAAIVRVAPRDPFGFESGPHRWVVTFAKIECPPNLVSKRQLRVTINGRQSLVVLHHPREATRLPCPECLSTKHFRKECMELDAPAKAAKFVCEVDLPKTADTPILNVVPSMKRSRQQVEIFRTQLAPDVAA